METGPALVKSSCFRPLSFNRDSDNWEGDIWHMVQHMRGDRHLTLCWNPGLPAPARHGVPLKYGEPQTKSFDPAGHSIKRIAVMDSYDPLTKDEAAKFQQLLRDAYQGDLEAVEASFGKVKKLRDPKLNPLQPVATFGAVTGHLSIVQFALKMGASMDRDLALAIQMGAKKNAEMKEFYENDSKRLNVLINPPPDPNVKPNVPDEWRRIWDELCPR